MPRPHPSPLWRRIARGSLPIGIATAVLQCSFDTTAPTTSPAAPNPASGKLAFISYPGAALPNRPLDAIRVQTVDAAGNVDLTNGTVVALTLRAKAGSPPSLAGPLTATTVNGTATFTGLAIAGSADSLSFVASASGSTSAASPTFNVDRAPLHVDSTATPLTGDSVARAAGTYAFIVSSSSPIADSGSVLVGTEQGGFIRRVVHASRSGSVVTYQTVPASLDEIVQNDSLIATINPARALIAGGERPRFDAAIPGVSCTLPHCTLTAAVLSGTASNGLMLTGTMDVTAGAVVQARWGNQHSLNAVHLLAFDTTAFGTDLSVSVGSEFARSGSVLLGTYSYKQLIFIGEWPTWVSVNVPLTLEWSLDAGGQVGMDVSWSATAIGNLGVDWSATAGFSPIKTGSWTVSPVFGTPKVQAQASAHLGLQATPRVTIDGVSPGDLIIQPFIEGSVLVDALANQWSTTCHSALEVAMDLDITIFGHQIGPSFQLSANLFDTTLPVCAHSGSLSTPTISVNPATVTVRGTMGSPNPQPTTIQVSNGGSGNLTNLSVSAPSYGAGQTTGWLSVGALTQTTAPATFTLTPSIAGLAAGTYSATINLSSTEPGVTNSPQSLSVALTVAPGQAPTIALSTLSTAFAAIAGSGGSQIQRVAISNSGTGQLSGLSVDSPVYPSGQPTGWLAAALTGSTAPDTAVLTVSVGSLPAGNYSAAVSIRSNATGVTNSPQSLSVSQVVSDYTVSVSSSPSAGGTVAGGAGYASNSTATVVATANPGYSFANWTENGSPVSSSASYTFTVTRSRSLVANFTSGTYTIAVAASPISAGSVSGGGSFGGNAQVTVSATPNAGYTFTNWSEAGQSVSTNASYTFAATANRTLVANFSGATYSVSVAASPSAGGSVNGGGTYAANSTVTVNAQANNGYQFTNWVDANGIASLNPSYSFGVTANRNLTANFAQALYSISAFASPSAGGSTTGSGTYAATAPVTLTATANSGYSFVSWTENAYVVSTSATYSFNANANRSLAANFNPTGLVQALATNLNAPWVVATDGSMVYWAEKDVTFGAIRAVPVGGGAYTTLATGLAEPAAIGVDASDIYWIERNNGTNGTLKKMSKNGGTPTVLLRGLNNAQNYLVLDAFYVYFADGTNTGAGLIRKVAKDGSSSTVIANTPSFASAIATDSTYVYFSDGFGNIKRVGNGGGTSAAIASGYPSGLAVYGGRVYWGDYTGLIASVPRVGGTPLTLATGAISPAALAVDGTKVYWVEFENVGGVRSVPINGGAVSTLGDEANTEGLALMNGYLYWPVYRFVNQGKIERIKTP